MRRHDHLRFQSTLLTRGATVCVLCVVRSCNISIHAPHARSDLVFFGRGAVDFRISIHAPHARSDVGLQTHIPLPIDFNPRSSREERLFPFLQVRYGVYFNPRLLTRRSDKSTCRFICSVFYFNPRSTREERHRRPVASAGKEISITLLTEERRRAGAAAPRQTIQSTLLTRGATGDEWLSLQFRLFHPRSSRESDVPRNENRNKVGISIHAPHARSDSALNVKVLLRNFNPRSPRRGATPPPPSPLSCLLFQSTLLTRGATGISICKKFGYPISIHVLTRERPSCRGRYAFSSKFQSLSSREERPCCRTLWVYDGISIHAPHAEDDKNISKVCWIPLFQSTLLTRGATTPATFGGAPRQISIHALTRGATAARNASVITP